MSEEKKCNCETTSKLIFACSGASDVGGVADQAARQLAAEGEGKMICLAAIGAHNPEKTKVASEAEVVLAIDGCTMACVKNTLEQVGVGKVRSIVVTDLGYEKGKTEVHVEVIKKVAAAGMERLAEK